MKTLRSPLLWAALIAASFFCVVYARRNFSKALPVLRLDITMDRRGATAAAEQLAAAHAWSPGSGRRVATTFVENSTLTNFIELEAGGKTQLGKLLEARLITPYRWSVRLFKERDAAETQVWFGPDGSLLGFAEKLPQKAPGAALDEAHARTVAEKGLASFGMELGAYKPIESHENRTVSGRLDYEFTYERPTKELGAGRDMLVLTVRGDRFCGMNRTVRIPDDFFRRWETMRSANNSLQTAANVVMFLVLLLGGCASALVYVGRQGRLEWKRPAMVGGVLGSLLGLSVLNALPLAWFGYDTALSQGNFVVQQVMAAVATGLGMGVATTLILAAAVNLDREAFPKHPQLLKVFTGNAPASREVFGRVIGGYLLSGLWFAYLVWAYTVGVNRLGWWMPSSPLSSPTILGTTAPWLPPFANAFQAGLLEESLFRAVPLAWAAILGKRFGGRKWWIGAVLVLQAVAFGSAHAGYPNLPAWARLAELTGPAITLGGLYLLLGLVPCILIHFVYDIVLMALPLFASHAPGTAASSAVVIVLAGLPLWAAVAALLKARGWRPAPDGLWNAGWSPEPAKPRATPDAAIARSAALSAGLRRLFVISGVVAFPIWLWISLAKPPVPALGNLRDQAIESARKVLEGQGVRLDASWRPLAVAVADSDIERKMVWQTSGEKVFEGLLGNYLACPGWRVRFVRPSIPLPDRAEEYVVFVAGDGSTVRYEHVLPEKRKGAQLSADAARAIAERDLKSRYGLDASKLKLATSSEEKHPERRDWVFVWTDGSKHLSQGEARVWIRIDGDAPAGFGRFVFVPEEWSRQDRAKNMARMLVTGLLGILLFGLVATAVVMAIIDWTKARFSVRAFATVGIAFFALRLVETANHLPAMMSGLSTNESFAVQLARSLAMQATGALVLSVLVGLWAGQRNERGAAANGTQRAVFGLGLAIGALLVFGGKLIELTKPHDYPWHAGFDSANAAWLPLGALWATESFIGTTLAFFSIHRILDGLRHRLLRPAVLALIGLLAGAVTHSDTWLVMVLSGAAAAVAFPLLDLIVQATRRAVLVPVVLALTLSRLFMGIALPGHPGQLVSSLVGIALTCAAAWWLYGMAWRAASGPAGSEPQAQ